MQKQIRFCHHTHRWVSDKRYKGYIGSTPPQRVNSFNVEFGYELIAVLPYAYWLHERGLLTETIGGVDTECLYWFSPKHTCTPQVRSWNNMPKAKAIPNIRIHRAKLDDRFSPPPLKEKYKNDRFVFDKPILCICNRVNKEWNKGAINFFDTECLEKLFTTLGEKYHIVYFNIRGKKEYYDGPMPIDINDYELAKQYGIMTIHDLHDNNPELSFNELQLMVMANCERFITMNGGYSILASYMGGTNLIYSKECQELKPEVNSFYRWYNRFGGSRIIHVDTYEALYDAVDTVFVSGRPVANIVMRTCRRPIFFSGAYNSVKSQTYDNVNLIVGYHDDDSENYTIPYKIYPVRYKPYNEGADNKMDPDNYGRYFPANYYMNYLFKEVKDGFVICLDDDDAFTSHRSLEKIMAAISTEDDLVLWRIKIGDRMIPSDDNFGKAPVARDISGIAFCCHSKHLKDYVSEPYKLWDYRIISHLYSKLRPVWLNEVLTKIQGQAQGGGHRLDKRQ